MRHRYILTHPEPYAYCYPIPNSQPNCYPVSLSDPHRFAQPDAEPNRFADSHTVAYGNAWCLHPRRYRSDQRHRRDIWAER